MHTLDLPRRIANLLFSRFVYEKKRKLYHVFVVAHHAMHFHNNSTDMLPDTIGDHTDVILHFWPTCSADP